MFHCHCRVLGGVGSYRYTVYSHCMSLLVLMSVVYESSGAVASSESGRHALTIVHLALTISVCLLNYLSANL
jgi:hypothetical protein